MRNKILLCIVLFCLNIGTASAALYPCNNSTGGQWGTFGLIPNGCDIHIFTDPSVVHQRYGSLIFDERASYIEERARYMQALFPPIRDLVRSYYISRNPTASETEISVFQRAVYAIAHQETYWSHFRIGWDGREKIILGDYDHGHGMMQVDDRSHEIALAAGKGWNLAEHMTYALDIFYSGWQQAPSTWCYQQAPSLKNRARAAYASYNGGSTAICRWWNNTTGDIQYEEKYDWEQWENYVADLNAPAQVDLQCIAEGNVNCGTASINIIIDDDDNRFEKFGDDAYWYTDNYGVNGSVTWTNTIDSPTNNWAKWNIDAVPVGEYELEVFIPSNRATSQQASYQVVTNGTSANVTINQNAYYDQWVSLGIYYINGDGNEYVRLDDNTGEAFSLGKELAFDAIRLVPQNPKPDLVIESISMSPSEPQVGDLVTFSAVVKNQGNAAVSSDDTIGVSYRINGAGVTWGITTAGLQPGQTVTINTDGGQWTADQPGPIAFQALVDDVNRIDETVEDNNYSGTEYVGVIIPPDDEDTGPLTNNGYCLDLHYSDRFSNGGEVQVSSCSGQPNQQWTFSEYGEIVNGYGKCLDVHAPDVNTDGGTVQVWSCSGQPNQQWSFDNGRLINGNGKCLDVHAPDVATDGGKVQIWSCHHEDNQQWSQRESTSIFQCPEEQQIKAAVGNLSGDSNVSFRSIPTSLDSQYVLGWISDGTELVVIGNQYGVKVSDNDLGQESELWYKIIHNGTEGWVNSLYLNFVECTEPQQELNGRLKSFVYDWFLPVRSITLSSDEQDHLDRNSINSWDISVPYGDPVYAMAPGIVTIADCGNSGGYGCWVRIDHGTIDGVNIKTSYAHFIEGSHKVSVGDLVDETTQLGNIGWTGYTTFGPHVHFVIHRNGIQTLVKDYFDINQMYYCKFCEYQR